MCNRWYLVLVVAVLALYFSAPVTAQNDVEILVGGNMEDSTAWNISTLDSQGEVINEFNSSHIPSAGLGGGLYAEAVLTEPAQILVWQKVTLKGGATYEGTGAFMDIGLNLSNFWCEILLSTEVPPDPDTSDYVGEKFFGFNTWLGCGPGVDGTFQDDGCVPAPSGTPGVITVPDTLGEAVDYYYCINIGAWTDADPVEFEVAVDEMSLIGPSIDTKIESHSASPSLFALEQNYPNPFNPQTEIRFCLPQNETVVLDIYNTLGRKVVTLIDNKNYSSGWHSASWDGRDANGSRVTSGVYYYKLTAGYNTEMRKLLFLK